MTGPLQPLLLLAADDLTGACDAAVHFARHRLSTSVLLDPTRPLAAPITAFSTDSRDLTPPDIEARLLRAAAPFQPGLVFKKIDSTLRGSVSREILSALTVFRRPAALVTPAYPALGRVVQSGLLHLTNDPDFNPIDVRQRLAQHAPDLPPGSIVQVQPGSLATALSSGAPLLCADASSEADLRALAAEALPLADRLLFAGSGGLAAALAPLLPRTGSPLPLPPSTRRGPVLFAIGSNHRATNRQRDELINHGSVIQLDAARTEPRRLLAALRQRAHVLLRIPRGALSPAHVRGLLEPLSDAPLAALFLSGGDTAAGVCHALDAHAIELCDEIVPGLPLGHLLGGALPGLPVVTKSGGFGNPNALLDVADYFA